MRLYKDVKVELTATLKINIHYLAKCPAVIRNKANGSMEILSIDMPYKSATAFEKTLSFIDYMQLVEDKKHMKVLCEQPIGQNVDYVRTDFERQDRTHVNFIVDYKAHFSYKIIVDVDGRLFIGNGSSFEDCFETKSGEKLEELIDTDKLCERIKKKLPKKDFATRVSVDLVYKDDVRLLPNNEEFRDAIYKYKDDILDAVDSDLTSRFNGDSEDDY